MQVIARHVLVVALVSGLSAAAEAQTPQFAGQSAGTWQDAPALRPTLAGSVDWDQISATQPPASGRDSLLNGILIGAAVGGLLGLIPDYYDDCEECHDSLYASIAVGAGIGLLVDALRTRPPKAQPPGTSPQINLTVGRRGVSVRAAVGWR